MTRLFTISEIEQKAAANRKAWSKTAPIAPKMSEKAPPRVSKGKKVSTATEHEEQCAVVAWFAQVASCYGLDSRLLSASGNGSMLAGDGKLRAIQSQRLKNAGMVVGDPDLMLRVARHEFYGLIIEMKRTGWRAPKSGKDYAHWKRQLEMHDLLRGQGYLVATCHGAESAISVIRDYLE